MKSDEKKKKKYVRRVQSYKPVKSKQTVHHIKEYSLPELNHLSYFSVINNIRVIKMLVAKLSSILKEYVNKETQKESYQEYVKLYNEDFHFVDVQYQKLKTICDENFKQKLLDYPMIYDSNGELNPTRDLDLEDLQRYYEKKINEHKEYYKDISKENYYLMFMSENNLNHISYCEKNIEQIIANYTNKDSDSNKKLDFRKLWKILKNVVKYCNKFNSSTPRLNLIEKYLFEYFQTEFYNLSIDSYSDYEVVNALIKIFNYPVVPYIVQISKFFRKDKTKASYIDKNNKRKDNPEYDNVVNEEDTYHFWMATQHAKLNETTKDVLWNVFIQYGSQDKKKFNRLINNSNRFFKVVGDKVIIYSIQEVLEKFGFPNAIPLQYHRPLPSRRLFRFVFITNLAEADYLQNQHSEQYGDGENIYGFIEEGKLVEMPHGRSQHVLSLQAKLSETTVYRHLKHHKKKNKKIQKS